MKKEHCGAVFVSERSMPPKNGRRRAVLFLVMLSVERPKKGQRRGYELFKKIARNGGDVWRRAALHRYSKILEMLSVKNNNAAIFMCLSKKNANINENVRRRAGLRCSSIILVTLSVKNRDSLL
jgi:hypothetical protein